MQAFVVTCILLGLQTSVLGKSSKCENDINAWRYLSSSYDYQDVTRYYVSKHSYTSDTEAQSICKSMCGYLAEVNDAGELNFLNKLIEFGDLDGMLIAGTDKAKKGSWVYERTGKAMTFVDWEPWEPNNYKGQEHCNALLSKYTKMFDITCNVSHYKLMFACERTIQ